MESINIENLAWEILDMGKELTFLRRENARLKEIEAKYTKLLDESIQHGQAMMGNVLKACLNMDKDQMENAFGEDK